jgi:cation-transporting P-type ATPase C
VEVEVPVTAVKPRDSWSCTPAKKISVDAWSSPGQALVTNRPSPAGPNRNCGGPGTRSSSGAYVRQGILHVRAECVGRRHLPGPDHAPGGRLPGEQGPPSKPRATNWPAASAASDVVHPGYPRPDRQPVGAFTVLLVMACPCATVLSASTAISIRPVPPRPNAAS